MNKNTALTEHYEELRQRALGRQSSGVIWGLVVLRTKGMAGICCRRHCAHAAKGISLKHLLSCICRR